MHHVVYNAGPGLPTMEVLEFLRARGFSPQTLDDPNPDAALLYASGQSYIVRIAVPAKEARQALEALQAREVSRKVLVKRAVAQLRWQAALGLLISAAVVIGSMQAAGWNSWRFWWDNWLFIALAIALGAVLATIVIARFTESQRRRDVPDAPLCRACGYVLLGLTQPRCPECGHPFDPALLTLAGDPTTCCPDDDEESQSGDEQHEGGMHPL
jgi:hypothetical protein